MMYTLATMMLFLSTTVFGMSREDLDKITSFFQLKKIADKHGIPVSGYDPNQLRDDIFNALNGTSTTPSRGRPSTRRLNVTTRKRAGRTPSPQPAWLNRTTTAPRRTPSPTRQKPAPASRTPPRKRSPVEPRRARRTPSPKKPSTSCAGQNPLEAILSRDDYDVIPTRNREKKGGQGAPKGFLGAGASGVVWDAKPKGASGDGNLVIKVGRPHKKHYKAILKEADMLKGLLKLNIKNIVGYQNHYFDPAFNRIELVLEKVHDGQELGEISSSLMKRFDAAQMIGQVAGVLASIHLNSRAHNDLHTGNVMIDGNGNAHVIDWSKGKFYTRGSKRNHNMDSNRFRTVVDAIMKKTGQVPQDSEGRSYRDMLDDFSRGLDLVFHLSDVKCFRQEGENWIPCPQLPREVLKEATTIRENVDNLSKFTREVEIDGERYVVIG